MYKGYIMFFVDRFNKYKLQYMQLFIIELIIVIFVVKIIDHNYKISPNSLFSQFANSTWGCVINTNNNQTLQNISIYTKSRSYNPFASDEENKKFVTNCFTTTWHMLHLLGHTFLVMLYPDLIYEIIIASSLFEFYEYFKCYCHDLSDIGYNVIGSFIGYFIGKYFLRR